MVYCGQQRKIRLHNQTASCYFNHINFVTRYARTQGGPQALEFCLATCPMLKHKEPMLKNKGTLSATMPKLPPKVYILPNNEIPGKENVGFLAKPSTPQSVKLHCTLKKNKNCLQDIAKWRIFGSAVTRKSSSRTALRWNTLHLGRPVEQDEC